jgi:restriction endonuclease S subunit
MRSSRFRSDCANLATGTTAKGIKQANLVTINIPVPSLEEQARAVQIPTATERLIRREEQKLSQLNLIKQSLSADLLSGRKRVSV